MLFQPAACDELAGFLLRIACLASAGHLTVTRLRAARTATLAAFASTIRVVNRVLCGTADLRTAAEPAGASRLAQPHGRVFCIGKLTDGRIAFSGDHAHLGRRQLHLRESRIMRE